MSICRLTFEWLSQLEQQPSLHIKRTLADILMPFVFFSWQHIHFVLLWTEGSCCKCGDSVRFICGTLRHFYSYYRISGSVSHAICCQPRAIAVTFRWLSCLDNTQRCVTCSPICRVVLIGLPVYLYMFNTLAEMNFANTTEQNFETVSTEENCFDDHICWDIYVVYTRLAMYNLAGGSVLTCYDVRHYRACSPLILSLWLPIIRCSICFTNVFKNLYPRIPFYQRFCDFFCFKNSSACFLLDRPGWFLGNDSYYGTVVCHPGFYYRPHQGAPQGERLCFFPFLYVTLRWGFMLMGFRVSWYLGKWDFFVCGCFWKTLLIYHVNVSYSVL